MKGVICADVHTDKYSRGWSGFFYGGLRTIARFGGSWSSAGLPLRILRDTALRLCPGRLLRAGVVLGRRIHRRGPLVSRAETFLRPRGSRFGYSTGVPWAASRAGRTSSGNTCAVSRSGDARYAWARSSCRAQITGGAAKKNRRQDRRRYGSEGCLGVTIDTCRCVA
jgi:hypothetical protein